MKLLTLALIIFSFNSFAQTKPSTCCSTITKAQKEMMLQKFLGYEIENNIINEFNLTAKSCHRKTPAINSFEGFYSLISMEQIKNKAQKTSSEVACEPVAPCWLTPKMELEIFALTERKDAKLVLAVTQDITEELAGEIIETLRSINHKMVQAKTKK